MARSKRALEQRRRKGSIPTDEWLSSLKAGDPVVVANNYGEYLTKVDKIEGGYIIVDRFRYCKDSGTEAGNWTSENAIAQKWLLTPFQKEIERAAEQP